MPSIQSSLTDLATRALSETRGGIDEAKERRLRAIIFARDAGMSNRKIGEILGMTEAGVRRAVERANR